MARYVGGGSGRKPRPRSIPEDMVSCPPALNTTSATQKEQLEDRDFISRLKLDLSDIEEGSERRSQSTSSKVSRDTSDRLGYTAPDPPSVASQLKEKKRREREAARRDAARRKRYSEQIEVSEAAKRGAMLAAKAVDSSIVQRPNLKAKQKTKESATNKQKTKARSSTFRQPSHISIHSLESGSVSTLRSVATSVAGSVYTSATFIVDRPSWGHKVVAVLIFVGWLLHYHFFQRHGFQPLLARSKDRVINIPKRQVSMTDMKPVVRQSAVYLTQDYDNRSDFAPVKSVSAAFDTLRGEDYPVDKPAPELQIDPKLAQFEIDESHTMEVLEDTEESEKPRGDHALQSPEDEQAAEEPPEESTQREGPIQEGSALLDLQDTSTEMEQLPGLETLQDLNGQSNEAEHQQSMQDLDLAQVEQISDNGISDELEGEVKITTGETLHVVSQHQSEDVSMRQSAQDTNLVSSQEALTGTADEFTDAARPDFGKAPQSMNGLHTKQIDSQETEPGRDAQQNDKGSDLGQTTAPNLAGRFVRQQQDSSLQATNGQEKNEAVSLQNEENTELVSRQQISTASSGDYWRASTGSQLGELQQDENETDLGQITKTVGRSSANIGGATRRDGLLRNMGEQQTEPTESQQSDEQDSEMRRSQPTVSGYLDRLDDTKTLQGDTIYKQPGTSQTDEAQPHQDDPEVGSVRVEKLIYGGIDRSDSTQIFGDDQVLDGMRGPYLQSDEKKAVTESVGVVTVDAVGEESTSPATQRDADTTGIADNDSTALKGSAGLGTITKKVKEARAETESESSTRSVLLEGLVDEAAGMEVTTTQTLDDSLQPFKDPDEVP